MDLDVPSQRDFENLKHSFEAILAHLGLTEEVCMHPGLSNEERRWFTYKCSACRGRGVTFGPVGD